MTVLAIGLSEGTNASQICLSRSLHFIWDRRKGIGRFKGLLLHEFHDTYAWADLV
jgi:hypothetical protein